jgi:hypothetical protein
VVDLAGVNEFFSGRPAAEVVDHEIYILIVGIWPMDGVLPGRR